MYTSNVRGKGSNSETCFDKGSTICTLFSEQVLNCPEKVAIIEDGRLTTYSELAALASGIAKALQANGVIPGDRVALIAGRSTETVAAQLAVTVLGGAFVPLDPATPAAYLNDVIAEADPKVILMSDGGVRDDDPIADIRPAIRLHAGLATDHADGTPGNFASLMTRAGCNVRSDDMAYVIYTSGSTGRPKGVMVAHRGVCRLVRGQTYADLGPDQVMLNMAAVGFDASIGEIYSAILNGGTLAILRDAAPSLDRIAEVIARDGVTIAYVTAGLFHIIAEHRPEILAPLQQVFPCGDVLSEAHIKRVRKAVPHLRMINGYGPTENTVFTCCFPIDASWTGGPIPIGRGLAQDRLFVLDESLSPVPEGEVGQLAVGGAGVALGYLGRPDLTAASFVTLSLDGFDGRVYLTGDLVRMRSDGVVCFHGRADRQIKINGQRVELDAVEHALRADAQVEDAAVVGTTRPDGSRQITAFVKPATVEIQPVLDRLRAVLPAAAVPSRLLALAVFPLNASGKIDRKELARTLAPQPTVATPSNQPVRQAWVDVLGRTDLDDSRTFFDLGGTSLQLISLHTLLQQRLGRKLDIASLFEVPRLRDMERLLAAPTSSETVQIDPVAARRAAMAQARSRRGGFRNAR